MEPPPTTIFVGWMPYLTLSYPRGGSTEYHIGKARILPDDDATWRTITGYPRPKHLDIHEGFPELLDEGLQRGQPLYGTLITSDDGDWLRSHIDAVTAVVFFLADFAENVLPAECFTTLPLEIKTAVVDRDDNAISYVDKHSRRFESSLNLFLTPPIAVRGNLRSRRLSVTEPWGAALLDLIASSPEHRLVVAVRQYFRTQFSDPFTSPTDEDYALHCSALEAALHLSLRGETGPNDERHGLLCDFVSALNHIYSRLLRFFGLEAIQLPKKRQGLTELFSTRLADHFGDESLFKEFFKGLYEARSVFVHGSTADEGSAATKSLQLFRQTRETLPLLRLVTQEIIRDALSPSDPSLPRLFLTPARVRLGKCLHSNDTWRILRRTLTQNAAKEVLVGMSDQQFESVAEAAGQLYGEFSWHCVTEPNEPSTVCSAIKTCALAICSYVPPESEDNTEAVTVGTFAHNKDQESIEKWLCDDPWRFARPSSHDRIQTLKCIVRNLARRFDRYGVVKD
jgi:hypothetical protein